MVPSPVARLGCHHVGDAPLHELFLRIAGQHDRRLVDLQVAAILVADEDPIGGVVDVATVTRFALAVRLFDLLALGDVACRRERPEDLATAVLERPALPGEEPRLPVLAPLQTLHLHGVLAALEERRDLGIRILFSHEEGVDFPAEHVLAEELEARRIHPGVARGVVDFGDDLRDCGEQSRLALGERAHGGQGLAQLAFGPHPLTDVVGDGRDPRDLVCGVAERGEREHDVDKAAVPAHMLCPEAEAAIAAQQALEERLGLPKVVGRHQGRPVASDRLLGRVAVEYLGGGVPAGDRALQIAREDGVVRGGGNQRDAGHLAAHLLRLGGVAGGGEHGTQLAAGVAVDGGIVLDLGQRTGDVAQHQRSVAEQSFLEDPPVGRPRLLRFAEAVREVAADQLFARPARGLRGGFVDVGDLAQRIDADQRVAADLDEGAGVAVGLTRAAPDVALYHGVRAPGGSQGPGWGANRKRRP